jgi:choline dehydrogenase-like flavoprotein
VPGTAGVQSSSAEKGLAVVPKRIECDVCIIGGGITAALLVQKLTELTPGASIVVVEAGKRIFDFENRLEYRRRMLEYGENAWPGDFLADQAAEGIISRTMAVGGSALHWGGVTNRFSEEDLRLNSTYGLATDWPLEWSDLEKYYCEAERRLGVSGEPGPWPEDWRSEPYPMPPMPLSYNLVQIKAWADKSGIPFSGTPQAKNTKPYDGRAVCQRCNTCEICPTGARYSPDFTFKKLISAKKVQLHDQTLVRRLVVDEAPRSKIVAARAVDRRHPDEAIEYRAGTFVLASGYTWSPHLLLLSSSSRFPNGLANGSGLVGRYMAGHAFIGGQIEIPAAIYPGMNEQHSLISRQFFRCKKDAPLYVRHDLRLWESGAGREPRLRDAAGGLLVGDTLLADWRQRAKHGTARVRAYYDVHPSRDSLLTLDPSAKNQWGDPLPKIEHQLDEATLGRREATRQHILDLFALLAKTDEGKLLNTSEGRYLDHPAGGCRMGDDPASSVVDSFGRTHDHENLWAVGSPTLPTGGCTNGTLTFVALALRSADKIAEGLRSNKPSLL